MKEINLLITSAGRRVELIRCFQNAKKKLGVSGKIIAADMSNTAAACFFADQSARICRIDSPDYMDELMDICKRQSIHAIIPTIDTELYKLSEGKERIEQQTGAKVITQDMKVICLCRDKYKTTDFFQQNGFDTPRYITKEALLNREYEFPLFIKPLDGSSSINAFKLHNQEEVSFFTKYIANYILQEYIEGVEYSVDVFCDFDGNPVSIVPRRRLAVRSGEILKGITEKQQIVIREVKRLVSCLPLVGPVTVQGILRGESFYLIEMNPRFGGGAPMSIKAGADSTEGIYRLLCGEKLTYASDFEEGLLSIRFDDAIFINSQGDRIQ